MGRTRLLALVCLVPLCGCAAVGYLDPKYLLAGGRQERVEKATESFAVSLRWGRYEVAASHVEPAQRADFMKLLRDPEEQLRFTDYEIVSVELGPGMSQASALVSFKLHRMPSMTELSFADQQTWRYEPRNRRWYLEPNLAEYASAGR